MNQFFSEYNLAKFDKLESTSAKAKELAKAGVGAWTVVMAMEQGAGYGTKGSAWFSPVGGLYFSVILPKSNVDDLQILTVLAAFCVAKTIKEKFGVEPLIKLPNDVYLNGRKVCGILTENVLCGGVKYSVMGIGVNTNIEAFPTELKSVGASLKQELKVDVNNEEILGEIIKQLKNIYKSLSA